MSSNLKNMTLLQTRDSLHIKRKLWHFGTGFLALLSYWILNVDIELLRGICLFLTIFSLIVEFVRFRNPNFNQVFLNFWKPFLRKSEKNKLTGLPFYAFGVWLSLTFFELHISIISILFLVIADPLSSLIGQLYGEDMYLPHKSFEGSLTCFLVCYAACFFYLKFVFGEANFSFIAFSLLAGLIGAASEAISAFGIDDNLTIPFLSGLGVTILNYYFVII